MSTMDHLQTIEDSFMSHNEKAEKIKRPMNAFMLWSKQRRREISKNDPTIHNAQISKLLGEEWKILSPKEKQPYLKESQKLMIKHKKEHPNYRYKPRKNKQERVFDTKQPCSAIPSQVKPYAKYLNQRHHYEPSRSPYDEEVSRYLLISKRRPATVYYQSYGECRVPGCYECGDYQHPPPHQQSYEHSTNAYSYKDTRKEYTSYNLNRITAPMCSCCSPMFDSRNDLPPSIKSKSKSFTVESLIHQEHSSLSPSHPEKTSPKTSRPSSSLSSPRDGEGHQQNNDDHHHHHHYREHHGGRLSSESESTSNNSYISE